MAPKPPEGFDAFRTWLLALSDEERLYVKRWLGKYVTRFGQVPVAPSREASKAYQRRDPS